MVEVTGEAAKYWPRWRGPSGQGLVAVGAYPDKWSATTSLWKANVPGRGNSSPIVSKGKVFLQTAADDFSKRSLVCLDAGTGKILWSKDAKGLSSPKDCARSITRASDALVIRTRPVDRV